MASNVSAPRTAAPVRPPPPPPRPPSQPSQARPAQSSNIPGRRDEFQAAPAASRTSPQQLGTLSRKYESNGNPGLVSSGRGDHGGRSYGAYQFSSKTGSARDFTNWLGQTNPGLARDL